jgi:hypothetical protein
MYRTAILLAIALAVQPRVGHTAERLKIGGDGQAWDGVGLFFNALEVTDLEGLSPLEADPQENILPRIRELGGSATTSVTTAAARSNQIINELIDGEYTTGWRVYTNTNGAELEVDMGAIFVLQRIFFRRGVLNDDERSLRGYEFYVNDGNPLNFIGATPVYSLIAQNRSHGLPELDLSFSPTQVRYFKLRSTGERGFQMGDLEVFGVGVTPFAHYISKVIDLGAPANFGPISVYTRTDSLATALFSTKTGTVQDDSLYFRQTGIPGEFEEVPRDQFDRTLDPAYAGQVRTNDRDWSAWSPPYAQLIDGVISSPDNRRFLQFEFKLLSSGLLDKAVIDSVVINYTVPAIADSIVAEISPTQAQIGETNEFTYYLRSVVNSGNRGFDSVLISTPFASTATAVEVDGATVSDFTQEMTGGKLQVSFPNNRITRSGQEVKIHFSSLLTVSGTEFRAEVGDSQSDAFPQRVISGDASIEAEDNTLVVSSKIEDRLFSGVDFSSAVVTPNGDSINDELKLNYILLKATNPVNIKVVVHNLAGQEIVRLYDQRDLSGPNEVTWDGRDNAGQVVAPGLYLVRLSADTDAGKTTEMRSVAVVY